MTLLQISQSESIHSFIHPHYFGRARVGSRPPDLSKESSAIYCFTDMDENSFQVVVASHHI